MMQEWKESYFVKASEGLSRTLINGFACRTAGAEGIEPPLVLLERTGLPLTYAPNFAVHIIYCFKFSSNF